MRSKFVKVADDGKYDLRVEQLGKVLRVELFRYAPFEERRRLNMLPPILNKKGCKFMYRYKVNDDYMGDLPLRKEISKYDSEEFSELFPTIDQGVK